MVTQQIHVDVGAHRVTALADVTVGGSGVGHGSDLPSTSDAAAQVIGPQGTLTPMAGRTFTDGEIVEGAEISSIATIAAGAHVVFRNCRFVGALGQTTYTIRATNGGGLLVELEDCEVIARSASSLTPRCVTMWGDGNVAARRTIFRGGIDNCYFNPSNAPGLIATGDPLTPAARVLLDECWFGDIQRVGSSHSDGIQIDGGGYMVIRRSRIMGYSLPTGSDPLTTRVTDPSTANLASGPLICTQNSSNPNRISNIALRDCWLEGGNYTADLDPTDGLPVEDCAATGNKFGTRHNFGALSAGSGTASSGNTWGQGGPTACCGTVGVGEPVGG